VLRVTSAASFADAQLTAALVEFQQQYGQVEIVLSVGDKAADLVGERVDLAVRITNTLDPAMIARRLARCRSMLCASPDYLARHGLPRRPRICASTAASRMPPASARCTDSRAAARHHRAGRL
jgi:DNA-binding transcriptional LysR family regulator